MPLIIDRELVVPDVARPYGCAASMAGVAGRGADCRPTMAGDSQPCGGSARLAVWRIEESEEQLAAMVASADMKTVMSYRSPRRRLEALAWRAALRAIVPGAQAGYDRRGAPVLVQDSRNRFISVSHSGPFAAVMLAGTPCGIDVERVERDFSRAAPRFISPQEAALGAAQEAKAAPGAEECAGRWVESGAERSAGWTAEEVFPAAVWCAKEVVYKLAGREGLDLLDDIRITSLDLRRGTAQGSVRGGHGVGITFFEVEGYLVAWGVDAAPADPR